MDIRSLATHLGLSIGTVSRALNDRKDVNPQTRQRVIEAANTLGYTPNQSGRTLRSGRTGTVGFMLTLEHDSAVHGEPFFMALWEGVQSGLAEHGLDLAVLLARKGEDSFTFLRRHVSRGTVDAWLLSATQVHDERIALLQKQNIPFVALGRSETERPFTSIDLDFETVVSEAIALFVANGHRRIGLVAPPATINNSQIVIACYAAAIEGAGIAWDPELIHTGDTDESDGEFAARELMMLPDRPTALLLMGETAPVGAYRALRAMGLEPGQDIAVIGLRDNPACRSLLPELTCFTLDLEALGLALADAVVETLAGHGKAEVLHSQRRWPMQLLRARSHTISGVEPEHGR